MGGARSSSIMRYGEGATRRSSEIERYVFAAKNRGDTCATLPPYPYFLSHQFIKSGRLGDQIWWRYCDQQEKLAAPQGFASLCFALLSFFCFASLSSFGHTKWGGRRQMTKKMGEARCVAEGRAKTYLT